MRVHHKAVSWIAGIIRPVAIVIPVLIGFSGCTAGGGAPMRTWQELVVAAAPVADGATEFVSEAWWYDRKGSMDVIFVLTQLSMIVMEWDKSEDRYNVIHRLPYTDIATVSMVKKPPRLRPITLLVTEKDGRLRFFEMLDPFWEGPSTSETRRAFELLSAHIATSTISP